MQPVEHLCNNFVSRLNCDLLRIPSRVSFHRVIPQPFNFAIVKAQRDIYACQLWIEKKILFSVEVRIV